MFRFTAVCCCLLVMVQALPSGLGSSGHQLSPVPDLKDFSNINYPQPDVIDLGEVHKFTPETEIKVVRTIKITEPFPVKVPVKVPYPVPIVKEIPVKVTEVVKVSEPAHVDVLKSIQTHSSATSEQLHGTGPSAAALQNHWQPSAGSGHGPDSGHAETAEFSADAQEYQVNYHQAQDFEVAGRQY